jgi:hypothetical protein
MHRSRALAALLPLVAVLPFVSRVAASAPTAPARTLDDYRSFRKLAIDLEGRFPTRDEIAELERPDFDEGKWIESHTRGPAYVERLTRVYMDLLRLEPNLTFTDGPAQLYRADVLGPDGKAVPVFYRGGQRRLREATDGEFCFSPAESGQIVRPNATPIGEAKKVSKKLLDAYTVLVKPWWLYRDYGATAPKERYGDGWTADAEYRPVEGLLTDADGKPITQVRVCREEAQAAEIGHVYASGRVAKPGPKGDKDKKGKGPPIAAKKPKPAVATDPKKPVSILASLLPDGRARAAPVDRPYAVEHKGEPVACATRPGLDYAADCGCGVGLERCAPNAGNGDTPAFYYPSHKPLGPDLPLDEQRQSALRWYPYWWSREAVRFLGYLFDEDRDFREVLTGKETLVNGPLAQFYKTIQRGNCCGPPETSFGMPEESEALFDPTKVPADLEPTDAAKWELVADRGPHAAGLLTMPIFLEKYASARARAAALYNVFLCKSFVADKAQLTPSTEPDLTIRPGCSTCHATLEPLAAYFARVEPSSFVFLPEATFPARSTTCKKNKNGALNGNCNALYDVAFADDKGAALRSAHASPAHADAEPVGAARDITAMPEFARCAVDRVTSSFLGRPTSPDDDALLAALTEDFVRSGYRMRALVTDIVRSSTYRRANDWSSDTWRGSDGGGAK